MSRLIILVLSGYFSIFCLAASEEIPADIKISHQVSLSGLSSDHIGQPDISYTYQRRVDKDKVRYPLNVFWDGCDEYKAEKPCQVDQTFSYSGNELPSQALLDSQLVPIKLGTKSSERLKSDVQALNFNSLNITNEFYQIGTRELIEYKWKFPSLTDLYSGARNSIGFLLSADTQSPVKHLSADYRFVIRAFVTAGGKSSEGALRDSRYEKSGVFQGLPFEKYDLHSLAIFSFQGRDIDEEYHSGEYIGLGSSVTLEIVRILSSFDIAPGLLAETAELTIQIDIQNSIINRNVAKDFSPAAYLKDKNDDSKPDSKSSGGALPLSIGLFLSLITFVARRRSVV